MDVPWFPPSKRVAAGVEVAVAPVEFELYGSAGDVQCELSECAVIVFPSVVLLSEKVVAQRHYGVPKCALSTVELAAAPRPLLDSI